MIFLLKKCAYIYTETCTFFFPAAWKFPRAFHHATTPALIIFRVAFLRIGPFPQICLILNTLEVETVV